MVAVVDHQVVEIKEVTTTDSSQTQILIVEEMVSAEEEVANRIITEADGVKIETIHSLAFAKKMHAHFY